MIATFILLIVTGAGLILIGWLMYCNPNWINPYGDMPPERKALVDIDGLKKSACIACNILGGVIILVMLLHEFKVIGPMAVGIMMGGITLAFVVWVIVAMRKYNGFGRDENGEGYNSLYINKAAKITAVIIMVMVVAVIVVLYFVMKNR